MFCCARKAIIRSRCSPTSPEMLCSNSGRSAPSVCRRHRPSEIRTLAAIVAAVPVRLMKRDLLFVVERLAASLDERRLEIVARQRGIKKAKDNDSIAKLFTAYLRRAEEGA